jgi:hypothetical protein
VQSLPHQIAPRNSAIAPIGGFYNSSIISLSSGPFFRLSASNHLGNHAYSERAGVTAERYVNVFTDAARLPQHNPGVSSPTWPRTWRGLLSWSTTREGAEIRQTARNSKPTPNMNVFTDAARSLEHNSAFTHRDLTKLTTREVRAIKEDFR